MRAVTVVLLALALTFMGSAVFAQSSAPRAAPPARSTLIDRVVAVVNSEVITRIELTDRVDHVLKDLRERGTPLPAREELERQVLDRLILDKAQLQFARDTGLRVDDLDLDRTVGRVAENNHLSLTEFRRTLEKDGIAFDKFREEVRNEIVISRLREREVDNKIVVSDSEVDGYLDAQSRNKDATMEYNVAHILLRVPEQARPEQLSRQRARAEEVVTKLKGGADFGQLAATYSDAPDALKGGAIGWRERERLPELFVQALAHMQPGEVSEVLRSPAGFHVLKLIDRRGAGSAPVMIEQNHVRHILVRVSETVSEDDARRKLLQLRERIIGGADFADIARLQSDDGSSARGGDLGWIYPGDTVPEFERAFKALKLMELSQPVRTPFGFHLIQVLERRTADVSADRKRLEARKILRDRKSDEAYDEWLRQLRDRTYVEYRLDDR